MKINFKKEYGQLLPYSKEDKELIDKLKDGAVYEIDIKDADMRTVTQNRAFWKWADMIALMLNDSGYYVTNIIKLETLWNKDRVKSLIFNAVIENMGKKSSTHLSKKEIDELIDSVTKAFANKGISVPTFPSLEFTDKKEK